MKREGRPFPKKLLQLKEAVEEKCNCKFNYILAQWYSDDMAQITPHGDKLIGVKKTYNNNKNTDEKIKLSPLIMYGEKIQCHYLPQRK